MEKHIIELSKEENLKEFNTIVTKATSDSISYSKWLQFTKIYSELMQIPNINGSDIMYLGVTLYTANVKFKTKEEEDTCELIKSSLFNQKMNKEYEENQKYICLINSRLNALKKYINGRILSISDWLRYYDDFLVAYTNLKDINTDNSNRLIRDYIYTLLSAKVNIRNNMDSFNHESGISKLKTL